MNLPAAAGRPFLIDVEFGTENVDHARRVRRANFNDEDEIDVASHDSGRSWKTRANASGLSA